MAFFGIDKRQLNDLSLLEKDENGYVQIHPLPSEPSQSNNYNAKLQFSDFSKTFAKDFKLKETTK